MVTLTGLGLNLSGIIVDAAGALTDDRGAGPALDRRVRARRGHCCSDWPSRSPRRSSSPRSSSRRRSRASAWPTRALHVRLLLRGALRGEPADRARCGRGRRHHRRQRAADDDADAASTRCRRSSCRSPFVLTASGERAARPGARSREVLSRPRCPRARRRRAGRRHRRLAAADRPAGPSAPSASPAALLLLYLERVPVVAGLGCPGRSPSACTCCGRSHACVTPQQPLPHVNSPSRASMTTMRTPTLRPAAARPRARARADRRPAAAASRTTTAAKPAAAARRPAVDRHRQHHRRLLPARRRVRPGHRRSTGTRRPRGDRCLGGEHPAATRRRQRHRLHAGRHGGGRRQRRGQLRRKPQPVAALAGIYTELHAGRRPHGPGHRLVADMKGKRGLDRLPRTRAPR